MEPLSDCSFEIPFRRKLMLARFPLHEASMTDNPSGELEPTMFAMHPKKVSGTVSLERFLILNVRYASGNP